MRWRHARTRIRAHRWPQILLWLIVAVSGSMGVCSVRCRCAAGGGEDCGCPRSGAGRSPRCRCSAFALTCIRRVVRLIIGRVMARTCKSGVIERADGRGSSGGTATWYSAEFSYSSNYASILAVDARTYHVALQSHVRTQDERDMFDCDVERRPAYYQVSSCVTYAVRSTTSTQG